MNERTLRVLEYEKVKNILKEKTLSQMGKEIVEELKPSINIEEIEELQEETEEGLKMILRRSNPPLTAIYKLEEEVRRLELGAYLDPAGLLRVSDSLRAGRTMKHYLVFNSEDKDSSYPILQGLGEEISTYRNIEDEINKAIISQEEISDNASTRLRNIRRQQKSVNENIRKKLSSIINSESYKKYLQDNIITIREGRSVIPVKAEYKSYVKGIVHDISSSGASVFIEPLAIVELNNKLRELEVEEEEEIINILRDLSAKLSPIGEELLNNSKILARLDFIFAKAKYALEIDGTRPKFNSQRYINLKKARHPLLDKNEVVAIDIHLGKEFNTLVITGPNTGGKTVSLKTVGLLSLMGQSGLHIPADRNSSLGVFDKIFADIGDEQSIEQSLSTFSSHMVNIVDILENFDKNSLLLFDELGAGTDPTEGAALAMAILDYLLKEDVRTLATTHYSQLKIYALTTQGVKNGSVEFDLESLSPTYKLNIGLPGKSNAFQISERLGLNKKLIDYAGEFISKENQEFEEVLSLIEEDRIRVEENLETSEREKRELASLKEELRREKEKLEKSKDKILKDAREEASKILKRAKSEADENLKEIRKLATSIERDKNKKLHSVQESLRKSLDEIEADISENVLNVQSKKVPENLLEGETVLVLPFNQVGRVLTLPDEKGDLMVQVGIMKINSNIKQLKRTESKESQRASFKRERLLSNKSKDIALDIDLRGKALDEAIMEVDKYLDDAYIAGLKEVTLIHGKGTGVLRSGLKSFLRSHKHVRTSRLGDFNEGGDGVTVVELK